jgi:hypothetical protein
VPSTLPRPLSSTFATSRAHCRSPNRGQHEPSLWLSDSEDVGDPAAGRPDPLFRLTSGPSPDLSFGPLRVAFQKSAWAVTCRVRKPGMIAAMALRLLYLIFSRLLDTLTLLGRASASKNKEQSNCSSYATRSPYSAEPTPSPAWTGPTEHCSPAQSTPARGAARSPPGHPGHGLALAPPPGDQEVDLPEPLRSPTQSMRRS